MTTDQIPGDSRDERMPAPPAKKSAVPLHSGCAGQMNAGATEVVDVATGGAATDQLDAVGTWPESLWGFWTKINNDWIFNLAGLLAYNLLMALFPVLLLLLAGFGVVLQAISPASELQLQRALAGTLPGSTGVVLENCFGIVFRLRGRDPLRQNRMAFGMLVLYLVIVPIIFLASILPAGLIALLDPHGHSFLGTLASDGARLAIGFAGAVLFFGATYCFVPNRSADWRSWRRNWKGAVVAATLLVLYEFLFRVFERYLLHAGNYGAVAAFAIVILFFLYYLAFILLLGAELNSWLAGQRATATDLPGILHAVQVHHTLRGAAGPTAGMPREEMQRHSRARLVRYAEAVLRRASLGRPLTLRLPRYRRSSDRDHSPR